MTTTLTPPADAPLPWRLDRLAEYVEDADGCVLMAVNDERQPAFPYLVAAANACPELVAERDALRLAVAELRAVLEVVQNLDENDGIARGKLYREDAPTLFEQKDDGFGALYLGHAIERVMRKTKETP